MRSAHCQALERHCDKLLLISTGRIALADDRPEEVVLIPVLDTPPLRILVAMQRPHRRGQVLAA